MIFFNKSYAIFFLFLYSLLGGCSAAPEPGPLPPATQEGLNTFGCFVNGEPYIPKGGFLQTALNLSFSPNYERGTGSVTARIYGEEGLIQSLGFGFNGLQGMRNYTYPINSTEFRFGYLDERSGCWYLESFPETKPIFGKLVITWFDLDAAIISGTFEFILARSGCDTIRVTEGRFDLEI